MCITFIYTCTGLSLGVPIFTSNSILQMIKIIVNATQERAQGNWLDKDRAAERAEAF